MGPPARTSLPAQTSTGLQTQVTVSAWPQQIFEISTPAHKTMSSGAEMCLAHFLSSTWLNLVISK